MIVTVLIIGLLVYTTAIGWGRSQSGAMENIKLGLDLAGGVSITYQAKEENPSPEEMRDTIYKLQKRVEAYSTEANVYQEGDNRIRFPFRECRMPMRFWKSLDSGIAGISDSRWRDGSDRKRH